MQIHRDKVDDTRLEYSTQVLIKAALARDIVVDILDRKASIIRLTQGNKVEWIKQATRTSRDTHVVAHILDDKNLTKKLLRENGLWVPAGEAYDTVSAYHLARARFGDRKAVIKPNTFSGGRGISFLPADSSIGAWQLAFQRVLNDVNSLLVEAFVPGDDYRFLVIGYQTVAVVRRIHAYVVGDGLHTIQALVAQKNADPRRGENADTPLCPLPLDETAQEQLQRQQANEATVLPAGRVIYLRTTANISNGGDSVDVTDEVEKGYCRIAENAAQALGAQVTGVDMLLTEATQPPAESNYSVIELNANPALAIHAAPYAGQPRPVAAALLDFLGF